MTMNALSALWRLGAILLCLSLANSMAPTPAWAFATVTTNAARLELGPHLWYLEETTGQKTWDDIRTETHIAAWQPSSTATPTFGYTDTPYWFAVTLTNPEPQPVHRLLELAYPVLDTVALYLLYDNGTTAAFHTGDHVPFPQRPRLHRHFLFPITLAGGDTLTLYLRVQTRSALQVPLVLWDEPAFWQADTQEVLAQGLYCGVMLVMILYNLCIYLAIHDKSYLFYVLFTTCFTVFQMALHGFGYQYLWPAYTGGNKIMLALGVSGANAFGLLFTIELLQLKTKQRQLYGLLLGLGSVAVINTCLVPLLPYVSSVMISLLTSLLACLFGLTAGVIMWRRGDVPARFYTIAWASFLLGTLLFVLNRFNILPRNGLTENAMQFGSALEVVLLSLALANRINASRRAKEQAEYEREVAIASTHAKDQFLATMSHELRTPMQGVLGMLSLLHLTPLASKQMHYVTTARRSGEYLLGLLDDLLDFSLVDAGELTLVSVEFALPTLVEQVTASFVAQAEAKHVQLSVMLPDLAAFSLRGDPRRLQQILQNLLGNALKFTEYGVVTLRVSIEAEHRDSVVLRFAVHDTGIGIASEDQNRIFEAFTQADGSTTRKYGGTGLGLAICKRLVEQMGGSIGVESVASHGATFWFIIPLRRTIVPPGGAADNKLSIASHVVAPYSVPHTPPG